MLSVINKRISTYWVVDSLNRLEMQKYYEKKTTKYLQPFHNPKTIIKTMLFRFFPCKLHLFRLGFCPQWLINVAGSFCCGLFSSDFFRGEIFRDLPDNKISIEVTRVVDFRNSRVVGSVQQVRLYFSASSSARGTSWARR